MNPDFLRVIAATAIINVKEGQGREMTVTLTVTLFFY